MNALQFGGGKDSLACLYLLRDEWPTLTVAWMNTGAAFPETLRQMDQIRAMVPNFFEVRSDVLKGIEGHGWPTDVLPIRSTHFGQSATGHRGIMLQSWFDCCSQHLWLPLHQAMRDRGVTRIYRGQRLSEDYKSPVRSGQVIDGVEYVFPLEDWSEADVGAYLLQQGVEIPSHYAATQKSLDCWCCTAFLDAKLDQLQYLRDGHPEKFAIVADKLKQMREATTSASQPLFATEGIV